MSADEVRIWYVSIEGEQRGPYLASEVVEWLQEGKITLDDSCWRGGMGEWAPLRSIREFKVAGLLAQGIVEEEPRALRRPHPVLYWASGIAVAALAVVALLMGPQWIDSQQSSPSPDNDREGDRGAPGAVGKTPAGWSPFRGIMDILTGADRRAPSLDDEEPAAEQARRREEMEEQLHKEVETQKQREADARLKEEQEYQQREEEARGQRQAEARSLYDKAVAEAEARHYAEARRLSLEVLKVVGNDPALAQAGDSAQQLLARMELAQDPAARFIVRRVMQMNEAFQLTVEDMLDGQLYPLRPGEAIEGHVLETVDVTKRVARFVKGSSVYEIPLPR